MTLTYGCNITMHLELNMTRSFPHKQLPFLQNVFQQNSRAAKMRTIITGMQMIKAKTREKQEKVEISVTETVCHAYQNISCCTEFPVRYWAQR